MVGLWRVGGESRKDKSIGLVGFWGDDGVWHDNQITVERETVQDPADPTNPDARIAKTEWVYYDPADYGEEGKLNVKMLLSELGFGAIVTLMVQSFRPTLSPATIVATIGCEKSIVSPASALFISI